MIGTVEIVGGGIAGLTTGLAFARHGWRVRVHEQDSELRIPGAGIYIWENGLRILDALGVLAQVIADAIPASRHEKRNHDGTVFYSSRLRPDFRLYVPLRRTLLTALYDGLIDAGGEVVFGSRAIDVKPCGRIQFCDGSAVTADLVVAADGINSPLRDSLGLLRRRHPAGQFGYRAMIRREPDELSSETGRTHCEYWSGSRRLLYAPCTADLAYVQLTSLANDATGNQVPIDRDCWHRAFPRQDWIIDRLPDQGHSDWFERVQLKDWSSGRVALVGDAASAQPPFLGQGGGCAMMSGFALAEAVSHSGDAVAGIEMWKRRQRHLIQWVQRVAYWYGQLAFLPAPVRTAAFKAIDRSEALKRVTLLAAARHDPTAADYWYESNEIDGAIILPLMH
jgi:2-polyprenyl-6-methoxyphenol hydroxylase-like FAD-dependent oxidoreductase